MAGFGCRPLLTSDIFELSSNIGSGTMNGDRPSEACLVETASSSAEKFLERDLDRRDGWRSFST